jgi:signal transduction histidine kinase
VLEPELPIYDAQPGTRPRGFTYMRLFGMALMVFYVGGSIAVDPGPGLHGREPFVALAIAVLVVALAVSARRVLMPPGVRLGALLALLGASFALIGLQGDQSSAIAGIYFAAVLGALRLPRRQVRLVVALAIGGGVVAYSLSVDHPTGQIITILTGVPPWVFVVRVMREMRERQAQALCLVEELRESRAAQAAAAAEAERARVARDMHDVLAHSLSALAIQLELARVLTHRRGADAEVTASVDRAHGLATSGLDEARRAIGALRGEELPGPERLQSLVDAFAEHGVARCELRTEGAPRELSSEARLALYRTAQEALTNIRKHAVPERVELVLAYEPDGTRLRVRDHGTGAPVAVGAGALPSGGYGLTGMRERAELLGGRFEAGPTDDGFCVELWLPA